MDVSEIPLARLEERMRSTCSAAALRRLADALGRDSRAGARALGRRCQRRVAERRRLAGLFRGRARLWRQGLRLVAGVDEVGMGPLAGPVVAAAVVLRDRPDLPGLDDSKRLSPAARARLARAIREQALALAIGSVSPVDIDRWNIYQAGLEAMRRAVQALSHVPDHVLVDGREVPRLGVPQTRIVGGDRSDGSIAAASIVAKVHRDGLMQGLERRYPGYGFARHKGYATREHLEALERLGPCPEHRRSFAPVLQLHFL
ncbi:MAG: ribonuclease HII [Myxococcota bacterium]